MNLLSAVVALADGWERHERRLAALEASQAGVTSRLAAQELALLALRDTQVARIRRQRARRGAWWRAWWPTLREGLGVGAAALSLYGLLWAVLSLGALL